MPMVCPQCRNSFEERVECPTCGVRLFYQATRTAPGISLPTPTESWQQTPWGRLFAGLLLAQGLYYGIWHLVLAAKAAWPKETNDLLLQQGLQLLSLLIGGALAGAGHQRGAVYGAVVGIWNGALFLVYLLFYQARTNQQLNMLALYLLPILHTSFGAVGGLLGSLLWNPLPELVEPIPSPELAVPLARTARPWKSFAGPLAWGRVLAGTAVAVGGTLSASFILDVVEHWSDVKAGAIRQSQLMTWEIFALAMLAGSSLAGATRSNGPKQGLWVGVCTGMLLGVFQMAGFLGERQLPPPTLLFKLIGWLSQFDTPSSALPQILLLTLASTLGLGLAGGWFGSKLLPPIEALPRRRPRGRVSLD